MCDTSAAGPVAFVPVDVEWSGRQIQLEPVDEVQVLIVCDNTIDIFLLDEGPARRLLSGAGNPSMLPAPTMLEGEVVDGPLAQHGFSALVTVRRGERSHTVLFDTGITPDGCVENLRRIGRDPADIEAIVCSHGHFDHTAGLSGLAARLGRQNLPVVVHPEFWTRRRLAIPGREPLDTPTTSRRALEDVGFAIIEHHRPSFLLGGSLLITGEVDRTTDFERGFLIHQALRDGTWVPDPLILDDQALIANVAGKGLVVLTGCGHAGIVNICRYAQRLTGENRLHAAIGGFHLNGPLFEPIIPATLDAFDELAPDVIVPAHCSGWRAVHAIAARFPQQFIQTSVGTTFHLAADVAAAAS
ncbi:MAG TPA: MBL fold metallo-hydrolase [Mycobacteriales bacterium]|nr:MBL fold metallo-hydrolase [Mycobacteriales bacterium]